MDENRPIPMQGNHQIALAGKDVVVVGLKRTGASVAKFLAKRDARVVLTDMADENALSGYVQSMQDLIDLGRVRLELGGHKRETFENADLVVVSPGVPHTILPIRQALAKNVPVMGEIELASRFIQAPIAAITGTNGKTTTTELLGHMLTCSGIKNFVGGNIGTPLIDAVDQDEKVSVVVAEVSSFQLDTIQTFRPRVALLLNITDDHLDRYADMEAYAKSKSRIFLNQGPGDVAICNQTDLAGFPFLSNIKSRTMIFNLASSEKEKLREGAIIGDDRITLFISGGSGVLDLKGTHLVGRHNRENMAAASLAALCLGAKMEAVQKAVDHFKGLAHRMTFVAGVSDVAYYNDSKATNVDAVKRAMETFSSPLILIMGGRDKGGMFHLLKDAMQTRVKELIVMGEAGELLAGMFQGCVPITRATDMEDAVTRAHGRAEAGDVVLLSPGCASFDMYESYAHRGKAFEAAVLRLKEKPRGK